MIFLAGQGITFTLARCARGGSKKTGINPFEPVLWIPLPADYYLIWLSPTPNFSQLAIVFRGMHNSAAIARCDAP